MVPAQHSGNMFIESTQPFAGFTNLDSTHSVQPGGVTEAGLSMENGYFPVMPREKTSQYSPGVQLGGSAFRGEWAVPSKGVQGRTYNAEESDEDDEEEGEEGEDQGGSERSDYYKGKERAAGERPGEAGPRPLGGKKVGGARV